MHPQNERRRYIHELKHFAKMWLDTPRDLRSELPRAATFVQRGVHALAPDWLLGFLHRLQLVRFRLGIRTRFNELRHRLQLRTPPAESNGREDASGGQEPRQAS